VDGVPSNADDKTTQYTYDGSGHTLTVTVLLPGGGSQTTQFVYGVTTAGGSAVNSNDLLAETRYPDPITGAPSPTDRERWVYSALGDAVRSTDRDGTTHAYTLDTLGRQVADAVTTLGAGVDGAVRRIATGYDALGDVAVVTSFDAATGGTIVNQVVRAYNAYGQLAAEYQAAGGAVDPATTPAVRYAYTGDLAWENDTSRLIAVTYPSGRVVNYDYAYGVDGAIGRLTLIHDATGTLETYAYLGLGTVVEQDRPAIGINLTYISPTGGTGDPYTGLDRFGRVVDQLWFDTNVNAPTDWFRCGYDADGNVTYRDNLLNAAFGEMYGYDGLNQVTGFARGTLNGTKDGIAGTPAHTQTWALDALGNWLGVTTDGTTQTRTANQLNQITGISGATTPTYDAAGNLTGDEARRTATRRCTTSTGCSRTPTAP
jgi:YD repeat-containing protein